ncbi:MAG: hypothetical protein AAF357_12275 [Verrucomicrobiota bacterium]
MNKLSIIALTLAFVGGGFSFVEAQDSEFGMLPPMPMLDLGDPERELTWSERRRLAMIEKREQASIEAAARSEAKAAGVSTSNRVKLGSGLSKLNGPRLSTAKREPIVNSISSTDDALTASGNRLMPFGEEGDYWAGMPMNVGDQIDINLPPMPDLRTPDQVLGKERYRNRRVAKQEQRKSLAEAQREEAAIKRAATVSRPQADPSTALVQVQSGQPTASPGYGNLEAPETVTEGNLKPFNSNSVYIKNNQQVFRGDDSKKGNGLFGLFGRQKSE